MKNSPIFIVFLFLAVSTPADAHQVILNPSKDAGIKELNPTTNYGDIDHAWIGYSSGRADSLVAFDLSAYMGTIVESAFLELYVYYEWGTIPDDSWVDRVDGGWVESTVTWNNSPGNESSIWFYIGTPTGGWFRFEVTSIVETWIDGSFPNDGFYLACDSTDFGGFRFFSKEWYNPDYHLNLELNYHDVSVQPTSLGIIKAIYK